MNFTMGLIVGLVFGALIGVTIMCLLVVAKEADRHMEED